MKPRMASRTAQIVAVAIRAGAVDEDEGGEHDDADVEEILLRDRVLVDGSSGKSGARVRSSCFIHHSHTRNSNVDA